MCQERTKMSATGWTLKHRVALSLITKKQEERRHLNEAFAAIEDLDAFEDGKNGHLSLLFQAVIRDNFEAFQTLLELGADPTKTNKRGINVLHLIAKRGNVKMANLCLKHIENTSDKISFINNSTDIGWSVLIQACSMITDEAVFVKWLLDNGADINHYMKSGWTGTHAASYNSNKEVLSLLLDWGADINISATKKDVPPHKNLKPRDVSKSHEIRQLFDSHIDSESYQLHNVVQSHSRKEEQRRQMKEAFVSCEDLDAFEDGKNGHLSLLFQAVIKDNFEEFQTLLELGASPTKTNKRGINVLHLIAKRGNVKMAELCLGHINSTSDKISFINNSTDIGWSVLIQACSMITDEAVFVKWLLDNGADMNQSMKSGWTAMHAASYNGNKEALSMLLDWGADINIPATKKDVLPHKNLKPRDVSKNDEIRQLFDSHIDSESYQLHNVVQSHSRKEEQRRRMREAFASCEDLDAFEDGKNGHLSLLFQAAIRNNIEKFHTLLELGADPTKTNKRGINVLHLIAKRGNVKMAELCLGHIKSTSDKISFINNSTAIGWSVLIQACSMITDEAVFLKWLLDKGADMNHSMASGWTAMHAASYNGNKEVLSLMLNSGANRNSMATKRDVPPHRNLKPRDVSKNDEIRNMFDS
jgi:ankyrin repeat protein